MKMARLVSVILVLCSALSARPSLATPTWSRLHAQYGMNPQDHAFCFRASDDQILGVNQDRKVRLASVSKLLTTLWAIETKGPTFQYQTHFYFLNGALHIQGSRDTVFSRRKLFYLVNQLNQLGIDKVDSITFDSQTLVFAGAEDYIGSVLTVTPERTAQNLKDFLHTPGWQNLLQAYRQFYNETPSEIRERFDLRPLQDLQLSIGQVRPSDTAPFDLNDPQAASFSLLSSIIEDYMKVMNIVSNNYIADQTFENLGGEQAFDQFISPLITELLPDYDRQRQNFANGEASIKMYTGSGLPETVNGHRVDNFASCRIIIKLIERLEQKAQEYEGHISRLVAVTGSDAGTLRARLQSPVLKNSIVAKTGSLFHTSALAGIVYGQSGVVPFGIFHHLTGSKAQAQMIQNQMVRTLSDQYGGASPFSYSPQYFFPVSDTKID